MTDTQLLHDTESTSTVFADLGGPRRHERTGSFLIEEADGASMSGFRDLRRHHFVARQHMFDTTDVDAVDDHPDTIVLVARRVDDDEILGGVRIHPVGDRRDGWWIGGRLVAATDAPRGVGEALVRAACSRVEAEGALRFDARVQADKAGFFARLGWTRSGPVMLHDVEHVLMQWPIPLFARTADHKAAIGRLVAKLAPGGGAWVGDDGAPVPGTDVIAVTDAILPAMVERDPWWAGWCAVLVNVNDLTAMGAAPVGLLDTLAAPTESLAQRVIAGMNAACTAWNVPTLGGHTQIGVHAALSVTMLGRTDDPVPGGGARPGQRLSLVADLGGEWRPGYTGRQWDSTSSRSPAELRRMQSVVRDLRPSAAKDVSMAGLVGTTAMMAEASHVGVTIDLGRIPRPDGVRLDHWLTCFPGFAMLIAHDEPIAADDIRIAGVPIVVAEIGRIEAIDEQRSDEQRDGVTLRWPDGLTERVLGGDVTGLGPTTGPNTPHSTTGDDTDV